MNTLTRNTGLLSHLPTPFPGKSGWPWTVETNPSLFNSEMEYPKISIVTPSYNQGQFLEETIRSVLLQNYPNLEYIIIDGGSSDNSIEIIRKYEKWITYWISEKDEGQSQALNKGLKICTGMYSGYLNSDDLLTKCLLFNYSNKLGINPEIDIIYGYSYIINKNSSVKNISISLPFSLENYFYGIHQINQPGSIWKHKKYLAVNGFNEDNKTCMDAELYLNMFNIKCHFYCCDLPVSFFRIHEHSITGSNRLDSLYQKDSTRLINQFFDGKKNNSILQVLYKIKSKVIKIYLSIRFLSLSNLIYLTKKTLNF